MLGKTANTKGWGLIRWSRGHYVAWKGEWKYGQQDGQPRIQITAVDLGNEGQKWYRPSWLLGHWIPVGEAKLGLGKFVNYVSRELTSVQRAVEPSNALKLLQRLQGRALWKAAVRDILHKMQRPLWRSATIATCRCPKSDSLARRVLWKRSCRAINNRRAGIGVKERTKYGTRYITALVSMSILLK